MKISCRKTLGGFDPKLGSTHICTHSIGPCSGGDFAVVNSKLQGTQSRLESDMPPICLAPTTEPSFGFCRKYQEFPSSHSSKCYPGLMLLFPTRQGRLTNLMKLNATILVDTKSQPCFQDVLKKIDYLYNKLTQELLIVIAIQGRGWHVLILEPSTKAKNLMSLFGSF